MRRSRTFFVSAAVGLLASLACACSTMNAGTVTTGMTPEQATQAMGQPDLKDNIADPNHSGASVQRYVWLDKGKAAVFGTDNHVASIQDVETNTKQRVEQQASAQSEMPRAFDPIETPMNYLFFPLKAGLTYFGAGVNCVGGGGCHKPTLPPPSG